GGRAGVGDEFGKGDIGLVADGCADGDGAAEDRLGDDALVERPQVFDAPAAAGEDDGVEVEICARAGGPAQRAGDLGRGALALHANIDEGDFDGAAAAAEGVEHILQGSAGAAGDD